MARSVGRLRQDLARALAKGKRRKALECYVELERAEPKDPVWCHRAGELYAQLGEEYLAIPAWTRAAEKYATAGFLVKAIAMCRMILRVDPEHTEAQNRLVRLQTAHVGEEGRRPSRQTKEIASVAGPAAASGAPLSSVPLYQPKGTAKPITLVPLDAKENQELGRIQIGYRGETMAIGGDAAPADVAQGTEPEADVPILFDDAEPLQFEDADLREDTQERRVKNVTNKVSSTPLFSELAPAALRAVVERMKLVDLAAGQVLFNQGDAGDTMYVIVEGDVSVLVDGPAGSGQIVALSEGAFFGEIALVTEEPRTATIRANTSTMLLALGRREVGQLVTKYPSFLRVLLRFLRQRLVDTLVRTSPLFEPFSEADKRVLAQRFRFFEVQAGADLIRQGEMANALYVILCGQAESVRKEELSEKRLGLLRRGDMFGINSLLSQESSVATVRARKRCWALALPARDFRELIMTHPHVLAYVGELAEERRQLTQAILEGSSQYEEGHVDLH